MRSTVIKRRSRQRTNRARIAKLLIADGQRKFDAPREFHKFTNVHDADVMLNDLERYPHAFVLGCIMDQQVKAELAWVIPYRFSQELGTFRFKRLSQLKQLEITRIMSKPKPLHRFHPKMSKYFYEAIQLIGEQYDGNAGQIWADEPSSAEVVFRFLQFPGVGLKIATMAVNLLARDFKVPLTDYFSVDVSADVHVRRVFGRLGLAGPDDDIPSVVYSARALHPEFPGLLDSPAWRIGRTWCHKSDPLCDQCMMRLDCPTANNTK
jgi:endonuclease III